MVGAEENMHSLNLFIPLLTLIIKVMCPSQNTQFTYSSEKTEGRAESDGSAVFCHLLPLTRSLQFARLVPRKQQQMTPRAPFLDPGCAEST